VLTGNKSRWSTPGVEFVSS